MTENTLTSNETKTLNGKIKAIYPHITVTGDVDNPYYNIEWYDIEKQTMYRGYSSYKLPLVRKWLQENFEVVEADIDDLINRQKAEIERLEETKNRLLYNLQAVLDERADRSEAVKEFAERLKESKYQSSDWSHGEHPYVVEVSDIDNLVEEMVGEQNAPCN